MRRIHHDRVKLDPLLRESDSELELLIVCSVVEVDRYGDGSIVRPANVSDSFTTGAWRLHVKQELKERSSAVLQSHGEELHNDRSLEALCSANDTDYFCPVVADLRQDTICPCQHFTSRLLMRNAQPPASALARISSVRLFLVDMALADLVAANDVDELSLIVELVLKA